MATSNKKNNARASASTAEPAKPRPSKSKASASKSSESKASESKESKASASKARSSADSTEGAAPAEPSGASGDGAEAAAAEPAADGAASKLKDAPKSKPKPKSAAKAKTKAKSKAKAKTANQSKKVDADAVVDPREPVEPSPKHLVETLQRLEEVVAKLDKPAEPGPGDLVDVMVHGMFAEGLPCGVGQEVLRRFAAEYVDRNEFRVTEAHESELVIADLPIPNVFERCLAVQQAVNQIYADQNRVDLEHLREATMSDRKSFFQRVQAIPPEAVRVLQAVLNFEEIAFSPRSTQRVQQRVGLDPSRKGDAEFVDQLRALLAPFGYLPLRVGSDRSDGKPLLEPTLSPVGLLVRLTPRGRK